MQVQRAHPSVEELSAFGLGQLDDVASAAIESHLAACATCCVSLETVREDAFVTRLRTATLPEPALDSPPTEVGNLHEAATCTGPAPPAPPAGALPPALAQHPRYRILQVLGSGGMGIVYKAEHQVMERPVALKVIRHDLTREPAAVERFRREVRAAARLAHPNIVTAHD